ncbi:alpha/beta hydrolase [Novosphingobium sp.]|uniref:alpha/beta hydrolase n=1 Tax=Novosphingobium sp. TaxID=1874826 RepID=UPI00260145DA|nr:alpha/beta hydrolase [Novosphingobium sp.]
MRTLAALLLPLLALTVSPAAARAADAGSVVVTVEEVVFESQGGSERIVGVAPPALPRGIATYGPFRVLDAGHAALVDVTDARSPAQFGAMLKAHPGIAVIEMIECPGTEDDRANLLLGRMIHARGIATHVPAGGSVRSGGVELFLAGARRVADEGSEFAVHAWEDEDGREATDYPADAPENRAYLDYYREMGMTAQQAASFYAMTNSVPFANARWLTAADMRGWVSLN